MSIRVVIFTIFVVDTVLAVFSFYQGENWLINTQVAFFSSLFVTLSSFLSYKRLIHKRLESEVEDMPDFIDKIEDSFDLYSKDDKEKDFQEIIKEERAKLKGGKTTMKNLFHSLSGAFNPLRLLSYLFLFVGFVYLVNNQQFELLAYLIGLFVVPFSALLVSFVNFKRE